MMNWDNAQIIIISYEDFKSNNLFYKNRECVRNCDSNEYIFPGGICTSNSEGPCPNDSPFFYKYSNGIKECISNCLEKELPYFILSSSTDNKEGKKFYKIENNYMCISEFSDQYPLPYFLYKWMHFKMSKR